MARHEPLRPVISTVFPTSEAVGCSSSKPYGLTGFSHFPPSAAGTGYAPGTSALYAGGVDVKVGLRSNLAQNQPVQQREQDSSTKKAAGITRCRKI
jgi:hypothetical protein